MGCNRTRRPAEALLVFTLILLAGCDQKSEDAGTLMSGAWQALRVGETRLADELFVKASRNGAAPAVAAEAAYGRAMLLVTSVDPAEQRRAKMLLDESVRLDPAGTNSPWVRLAIARWVDAQNPPAGAGRVPDAVPNAYQDVIDAHPAHPAAREAAAASVARLAASPVPADLNRAIELADLELSNNLDPQWHPTLQSLRADAFRVLGRHEARLDALVKALDATKKVALEESPDVSGLYWSTATAAEFDVGDLKLSRSYYQKLLDEYPQDQRGLTAAAAIQRIDRIESRLRAGDEAAVVLREEAP